MLLISLKTIIQYIKNELPTEHIKTTDERKKEHDENKTEDDIHKNDFITYEIITMFNRNEVTPFNPNVLNDLISSGYFNNVLVNLVKLQLSLESYKQSRDYLYYNALKDNDKHNFNVNMLNRAMDTYLKQIKILNKELNI